MELEVLVYIIVITCIFAVLVLVKIGHLSIDLAITGPGCCWHLAYWYPEMNFQDFLWDKG